MGCLGSSAGCYGNQDEGPVFAGSGCLPGFCGSLGFPSVWFCFGPGELVPCRSPDLDRVLVLVSGLFLSPEPLRLCRPALDRSLDPDRVLARRVLLGSFVLAGSSSYFWADGTRLWTRTRRWARATRYQSRPWAGSTHSRVRYSEEKATWMVAPLIRRALAE